jgi:hypothetical protein
MSVISLACRGIAGWCELGVNNASGCVNGGVLTSVQPVDVVVNGG